MILIYLLVPVLMVFNTFTFYGMTTLGHPCWGYHMSSIQRVAQKGKITILCLHNPDIFCYFFSPPIIVFDDFLAIRTPPTGCNRRRNSHRPTSHRVGCWPWSASALSPLPCAGIWGQSGHLVHGRRSCAVAGTLSPSFSPPTDRCCVLKELMPLILTVVTVGIVASVELKFSSHRLAVPIPVDHSCRCPRWPLGTFTITRSGKTRPSAGPGRRWLLEPTQASTIAGKPSSGLDSGHIRLSFVLVSSPSDSPSQTGSWSDPLFLPIYPTQPWPSWFNLKSTAWTLFVTVFQRLEV